MGTVLLGMRVLSLCKFCYKAVTMILQPTKEAYGDYLVALANPPINVGHTAFRNATHKYARSAICTHKHSQVLLGKLSMSNAV